MTKFIQNYRYITTAYNSLQQLTTMAFINELDSTKLFPFTVKALSNSVCDIGRIKPTGDVQDLVKCAEDEVLEFFDVLNVACENKPLAMTIQNTGWWRRLRVKDPKNAKLTIMRKNLSEVIAYKHGIRCIYVKKTTGYNCFYYREKDGLNNALKLTAMITLHPKIQDSSFTSPEYHYIVGKLLGYSIENIRYFLLTRCCGFKSTPKFEIDTDNKLEQLNINLSDFDSKKVSILKKPIQIPLETRKVSTKKSDK